MEWLDGINIKLISYHICDLSFRNLDPPSDTSFEGSYRPCLHFQLLFSPTNKNVCLISVWRMCMIVSSFAIICLRSRGEKPLSIEEVEQERKWKAHNVRSAYGTRTFSSIDCTPINVPLVAMCSLLTLSTFRNKPQKCWKRSKRRLGVNTYTHPHLQLSKNISPVFHHIAAYNNARFLVLTFLHLIHCLVLNHGNRAFTLHLIWPPKLEFLILQCLFLALLHGMLNEIFFLFRNLFSLDFSSQRSSIFTLL